MNGSNTGFSICLHAFKKICLGSLATEFQIIIGAELLLCFQPANTATQDIKNWFLPNHSWGGAIFRVANYPLVWSRKNLPNSPNWTSMRGYRCIHLNVKLISRFKQMSVRKHGTYVSAKKAENQHYRK